MKILLVNDYGTATGGAEIVPLDLRDELRRRGHDVRLFTSSARPLGSALHADATGFGTVSRWRTLVQSANPAAARALGRELVTLAPDVVHVHSYLTQLSPLILHRLGHRCPAVLHLHDYRSVCPRSSKQLPDGRPCTTPAGLACLRQGCVPLRDFPALEAQRRVDGRKRGVFSRVVANSGWLADRVRPLGLEVDDVIWNGVPVRPALAEPTAGMPTVVTFAGRLVPEKGVEVLLRSFALVRRDHESARMVVAGDGPELPAARALAESLGIGAAVSFPGHLDRATLERQLGDGTIHVVPSTWEEPFGRSAAEAMMRGQALVASAVGGLGELAAASGAAELVAPGNVDQLVAALRRLAADTSAVVRAARQGRAFALAELTVERFADRVLETYERAGVAV